MAGLIAFIIFIIIDIILIVYYLKKRKNKRKNNLSETNQIYPIEIFSSTIYEATFVKDILLNAGIESHLKDELMGTIAPWKTVGGGAGSVRVMISNTDFDKASKIIREYEEKKSEISE